MVYWFYRIIYSNNFIRVCIILFNKNWLGIITNGYYFIGLFNPLFFYLKNCRVHVAAAPVVFSCMKMYYKRLFWFLFGSNSGRKGKPVMCMNDIKFSIECNLIGGYSIISSFLKKITPVTSLEMGCCSNFSIYCNFIWHRQNAVQNYFIVFFRTFVGN